MCLSLYFLSGTSLENVGLLGVFSVISNSVDSIDEKRQRMQVKLEKVYLGAMLVNICFLYRIAFLF